MTITKYSNLNLIDRLQFPWLTAPAKMNWYRTENIHFLYKGNYHCSACLKFDSIWFYLSRKYYANYYIGSKASLCKRVKLETGHTVKFVFAVSVLYKGRKLCPSAPLIVIDRGRKLSKCDDTSSQLSNALWLAKTSHTPFKL